VQDVCVTAPSHCWAGATHRSLSQRARDIGVCGTEAAIPWTGVDRLLVRAMSPASPPRHAIDAFAVLDSSSAAVEHIGTCTLATSSSTTMRTFRRFPPCQPAEILAKMNSLIDEEIIEALYVSAEKGVRIRLNVRGICALRPGVPNLSASIEVVSIVDRFLEHSRIYYFLNGGEEEVYLASADWMTRNLDKRVELMFPIEQSEHRARVLHALRWMFRDNVKSR
jgi:hypothetical protein